MRKFENSRTVTRRKVKTKVIVATTTDVVASDGGSIRFETRPGGGAETGMVAGSRLGGELAMTCNVERWATKQENRCRIYGDHRNHPFEYTSPLAPTVPQRQSS